MKFRNKKKLLFSVGKILNYRKYFIDKFNLLTIK